jgi:hypothetical protein
MRDGEDEVERPGTLERRLEGGVREVCTRLDELISSASSLLARDMFLKRARLTTWLWAAGLRADEKLFMSLAFSMVEMKAAMSSSSVRALPELPGVPGACSEVSWPDFSLLLVLARPLLVALSPTRLLWEVLVQRLRPAKLLL